MSTNTNKEELAGVLKRYETTVLAARRGEGSFRDVAAFYTDDATYWEPSTGRTVGGQAIAELFSAGVEQMPGWEFPSRWNAIDGNRVVFGWATVLPVRRSDGSNFEAPGVAIMTYASDGQFSEHMDLYDRVQLGELLSESGLGTGS